MSVNIQDIDLIFSNKKNIKNKNILLIGDHNINFKKINNFYLKKFNLEKSINNYIGKISDKDLLKKIFNHFNFERLFICDYKKSKTVDFVIDLTQSTLKSVLNKKFGVVIDNCTCAYSTRLEFAFKSVVDVVDNNGLFITKADPMSFNRYPLSPSPDYIIDFFISRGFDLVKCDICDQNGNFIKKYRMIYGEKHYYIHQSLNFFEFLKYLLFITIQYFNKPNFKNSIVATDYKFFKVNNFRDQKKNFYIKKYISIKKSIFFLKKVLSQLIFLKLNNYGRLSISLCFVKDSLKIKSKQSNSSLYYNIKNSKQLQR